MEWCKETSSDKEEALMEALFKAYFEDGKDLSKSSLLLECASACGLACWRPRTAVASRCPHNDSFDIRQAAQAMSR